MFLGEAPRNVRERRRSGEDKITRIGVLSARLFLALFGGSRVPSFRFLSVR
jgi:hypothetical protein